MAGKSEANLVYKTISYLWIWSMIRLCFFCSSLCWAHKVTKFDVCYIDTNSLFSIKHPNKHFQMIDDNILLCYSQPSTGFSSHYEITSTPVYNMHGNWLPTHLKLLGTTLSSLSTIPETVKLFYHLSVLRLA